MPLAAHLRRSVEPASTVTASSPRRWSQRAGAASIKRASADWLRPARRGLRQAGERRPTSRVGFEDYFATWIESYTGRTSRGFSETTRPEYRRPIETYVLPRWRTWRLADVEPGDVRELFGAMRNAGATTSQIRKLRVALSALFSTAVDDGLLRSNPVLGVRIPADNSEPKSRRRRR